MQAHGLRTSDEELHKGEQHSSAHHSDNNRALKSVNELKLVDIVIRKSEVCQIAKNTVPVYKPELVKVNFKCIVSSRLRSEAFDGTLAIASDCHTSVTETTAVSPRNQLAGAHRAL